LKVVYFQRKRPLNFFSLESYFDNVRAHLPADVQPVVAVSKYYSAGLFKRLYNIVEAMFRQGDVNHITGDINFLTFGLAKSKTILTIHDLGLLQHPSPIARKILKLFWATLPVKRSTLITAVSETTKQEVIKHTKCDPDRIHVIYTCIANHFRRVDRPFKASKPVILQIGTVGNKNGIRMAEALQGIVCQLSIVGTPTPEHEAVLTACGIDYTISSKLTDEQMLQQYIDCDLLLFASTIEGFGMPIVEANAVGRAVVTSNVSSMPEIAGDAACLVDPFDVQSIRDGVQKVIENDAYRNQLVENGYRNAERFQVKEVAMQYYQLYKKVMKTNK
jgi:glycosyltransferase involved in cell wall biosynthesis